MARIRRRASAQVLHPHRQRERAARGARRVLETHQQDDQPAREIDMHKVIVINLNGRAYQVDEVGYDALRAYLDRAEVQLRTNPDLAEIMTDLEQAIGEKCQRFL